MDDKITLDDPHTVPTRYWHSLEDGRVQCDVCPRACRLHEGQRGLSFVRARLDDQIVLTSYGRSSGFCVDPVQKRPLDHFLPGSAVLSFGTAGCNLSCKFCQTGTSPSCGRSTRWHTPRHRKPSRARPKLSVAAASRSLTTTR